MLHLSRDNVHEYVGRSLGVSGWYRIDQSRIDAFADCTDDHQWIHTDVARATREAGGTIAHGFLTLSLLSRLGAEIWDVPDADHVINYGCNKLRFVAPVPAGAEIRVEAVLTAVTPHKRGLLLTCDLRVDILGAAKPALVAEWISLAVA
jgi:acyl dehydratase